MSKVEIVITTPAQALKDFATVWQRAEAGEQNITPSIGFGSPSELFAAITDKRLELLRHVATNEVLNIHQLAQALGRDYKNVHTDVKALEELGLLEREEGKLVAPFDELDIKVELRQAA
jgi:predicted transcriptional regulator